MNNPPSNISTPIVNKNVRSKNSMTYSNPNFYNMSSKKIIITDHALQRIKERTDYSQKQNIRKFVTDARYKGINVSLINAYNCKSFGISSRVYNYITSHFYVNSNRNKIIYYNNSIFVFAGNKSRSLITVVNLDKEKI